MAILSSTLQLLRSAVALWFAVLLVAQWGRVAVDCYPGNDLFDSPAAEAVPADDIYGSSFSEVPLVGSPSDFYNPSADKYSESFAAQPSDYTSEPSNGVYTYDATQSEGVVTADTAIFAEGDSSSDLQSVPATSNDSPPKEFSRVTDSNNTDVSTVSLAAAYGGCGTGNPIDDCWRCDPNWASHRKSLADCAIGFGRNAIGGKNGQFYVVTSNRDDNVANPVPGTLRHAVTRLAPLWIIFARSMTIYLKNELMITSFKTIDGRGVTVQVTGGAGFTLQYVNNVIIHGIHIFNIKPTGPARIMTSQVHVGQRGRADGDAISIFTSKNLWVDHCTLSRAADGLIDMIRGSTLITISNNYFSYHDKVMLLGAHPTDTVDRNMQITIAFNTFGPGLIQRMPRVRFGYAHVLNNDYTAGWGIYAIGGSEAPTILSEGNHFNPARGSKLVTKRISDGGSSYGGVASWNWKSVGDVFMAGSYFQNSGATSLAAKAYSKAFSCTARPGSLTLSMTRSSGVLNCRAGVRC